MGKQRKPIRIRHPRVLIAVVAGVVLVAGAGGAWRVLHRKPRAPVVDPEPAGPVEPAPRPATVVTFAQGCATSECHASFRPGPGVHGPVAEGACDACHEPDTGGHVFPVPGRTQENCTECHEVGATYEYQHTAMADDGCLACHDPHVSSAPGLLTRGTIEATCGECHPTTGGAVRHQPYAAGECISCHDQHAEDNPMLLHAGGGGNLCGLCHGEAVELMRGAGPSHGELAEGCAQCHSAHASNWPGLLNEDSADQCLRCHERVREAIATSVVTHRGAMTDRQCLTCHVPHASSEHSMLREDQVSVCLSCHDQAVEAVDRRTIPDMTPFVRTATNRHGPVDGGRCNLCHAVHGSTFPRLLRNEDPDDMIGAFDARHYALCFTCHDAAMLTEPDSTGVTAFNDGRQNLHYLHVVNKGRGRACSTCHVVHGGSRPRLMADFAEYEGSGWKAPLGFTLTPTGGSCSPGCHEPMAYVRGTGGRE
ncbi:MAG: cytochrome c3 family protein [Phycisphaeraceae bacterium]|nr:MAG: cytochrome c3 family protein [Phycisphaeraceae bacterium]